MGTRGCVGSLLRTQRGWRRSRLSERSLPGGRGAGLGRGCGKRRVEAPPRRAPPAASAPPYRPAPPAHSGSSREGRPAERRGAPPVRTSTTPPARSPRAPVALEGRERRPAVAPAGKGGEAGADAGVGGFEVRTRPKLPVRLSGPAAPRGGDELGTQARGWALGCGSLSRSLLPVSPARDAQAESRVKPSSSFLSQKWGPQPQTAGWDLP